MADDRERNQGMKQGGQEGGGQHAPGRNPQDDKSAGPIGGREDRERLGGGQEGDQQGGQKEGGFKEGGQNEETRR